MQGLRTLIESSSLWDVPFFCFSHLKSFALVELGVDQIDQDEQGTIKIIPLFKTSED